MRTALYFLVVFAVLVAASQMAPLAPIERDTAVVVAMDRTTSQTEETPASTSGAIDSPPGPAVAAKPDTMRGIYVNAWAAGSRTRREALLRESLDAGINTWVIDVKEGGEVTYPSSVPERFGLDAARRYILDLPALVAELHRQGIYPVARIVLFKDPVAARAQEGWRIGHRDGGLWTDKAGSPWVDPFNQHVWEYNLALARECAEMGFAEIQWDYVRFPDVPNSLADVARYPAAKDGEVRVDAIRGFLSRARTEMEALGVESTADVFGLTVSVGNDMGIGQKWEEISPRVHAILPMVYPSHFHKGSYGIAEPNAAPYQTVFAAMQHAVRRNSSLSSRGDIRAWIQAFTLGAPRYGAGEVSEQIRGSFDAGVPSFVLWHPGSKYAPDVLGAWRSAFAERSGSGASSR